MYLTAGRMIKDEIDVGRYIRRFLVDVPKGSVRRPEPRYGIAAAEELLDQILVEHRCSVLTGCHQSHLPRG